HAPRSMKWMSILMLIVTIIWAANAVAGKFALRGFPPLALAQLRVGGATLGFLAVYIGLRGWPKFGFTRRDWLFMAIAGFNGVTLNQVFYLTGLERTSVAHTALIVSLGPVMVLVIAYFMRMETLTPGKTLGMLIAFGGTAALAFGAPSTAVKAGIVGDALLLIGRLAFSYYTILVKQGANRYDALTLNTATFALGSLMMLPLSAPSLWKTHWRAVPAEAWEGLIFMVVFASVVAYLLFAYALTAMTASQASAYIYLAPVIAIALSVWLLAEAMTWRIGVAGAMILFGLFLTGQGKAEPEAGAVE
ncbi:MAG TPA: DMT family transporter, partial [Terriglobia bacterium]|nr:DMT family transporter [Terriglobia bacterium]